MGMPKDARSWIGCWIRWRLGRCGWLTATSAPVGSWRALWHVASFVIRRHGKLPFRVVGRKYRIGKRSRSGVRLYEQEVVIRDSEEEPIFLRQITVVRTEPTRDGEYEISILTNLPATDADATKISEIYASRWGLETAFQKLTEVLRCEVETLGYPKAALFAFSVALTSYNVVATVEAALRAL